MKVIMVSRFFPQTHIRKGQPTFFVEQIIGSIQWENIRVGVQDIDTDFVAKFGCKKLHTIRAGNRFKAGDMASLKVWSGRPYWTSPIEFAQVEIKQTIPININFHGGEMRVMIDGNIHNNRELLAKNDGLELADFYGWFKKPMDGQIICWQPVNY